MSVTIRKSECRGHANHGWLDSFHTFSFANYLDPQHMQFGPLRVINEDRVQPGAGFSTHGHRDMEILSYVIEGALEHRDSMGHGSVIRPGDVQVMSAGTGIRHSEFNPSRSEPVHFLQVWILPERAGLSPGYAQKSFPAIDRRGRLTLIASRDGRDGSLVIHQKADAYAAILGESETVSYVPGQGRRVWVQLVRGEAEVNGAKVCAGDGVAFVGEPELTIRAGTEAEFLLFDVP